MENHIVHEDQYQLSSSEVVPASLQLLITHCKEMKQLGNKKIIVPADKSPSRSISSNSYSTEQIMRIAAERFMDSSTKTIDVVSMLDNPFNFSLPDENVKKVELAELLMASAEKVSHQLYDRAQILINRCNELSSRTGNAVERVVYYFSKALQEMIDRKTEKAKSRRPKKYQLFSIAEAIMTPSPNLLSLCKELPFPQIAHCAGSTQAIIENVNRAKKIHIIDLGIKIGLQWASLMQAVVSEPIFPLKLLKITAVGTTMKQLIENTGKRLTSFAESIGLQFSFNIVMVSDILELREDLFGLEAGETVVVHSSYLLKTLIQVPKTLDHIMKVIRNLNPSIMMVIETELDKTSPSFAKRFEETVFYYSAFFDCVEHCLRGDPNRENVESLLVGEAITRISGADGDYGDFRHVKLEWRAFLARFGMVETQISGLSLYYGEQMAKKFASGNDCTLKLDGKSLLIGWKGTPLISFSAWKFKI